MKFPQISIDSSHSSDYIKNSFSETINSLYCNINIDHESLFVVINGIAFDKVSRINRHGSWISLIHENQSIAAIPTDKTKEIIVDMMKKDSNDTGRKAITLIILIDESLVIK